MNHESLRELFDAVAAGRLTPDAAYQAAHAQGCDDLGFAMVDHDRHTRCGFPEVVFAAGKTDEQILAIVAALIKNNPVVLVTRLAQESADTLRKTFPELIYNKTARTAQLGSPQNIAGTVLVVSAGTSDLPVAEEAAASAEAMGCTVQRLNDVGVAGLHRTLRHLDTIRQADVVIVVAGMEGALPSVIGGLVSAPVIAVPTSIGYGTAFGGITALLGMLNSCASGIGVVNIDNGFGAAALAARILR